MTMPVNEVLESQHGSLAFRLQALIEESTDLFERFDREVRAKHWHPFVAADYPRVLRSLIAVQAPSLRFLEWGSATGVIAIMADMLGFEAYGIELDGDLVRTARDLATRYDSRARFISGSFVPAGYRPTRKNGEGRLGTIGDGTSGYAEMGLALDDFDIVYAYPWTGEEAMMLDVQRQYGNSDALLLLCGNDAISVYRGGRLLRSIT
jgi:hypothetical protein